MCHQFFADLLVLGVAMKFDVSVPHRWSFVLVGLIVLLRNDGSFASCIIYAKRPAVGRIDRATGLWYDNEHPPAISWEEAVRQRIIGPTMHDDEIILSPAKYKELEVELERLSTVERLAIAERIKEARYMGDLSENFDYHDAKRQQGFLEGRIQALKSTLERAKVAEYAGGSGGDTVELGSCVKVHDVEYDEDIEYTIVGVMEADANQNKISNTSPLAKALLGHKVGDRIEVKTPAGKDVYEIIEVR